MRYKNYYDLLELAYDCSQEDINRSYYYYARMYHPELNSKSANLYRELVKACNVLSDPKKREKYDLEHKIRSTGIFMKIKEKVKYTVYLRDDAAECMRDTYNSYKDYLCNDEIIEKISNKIAIICEEIIPDIKQYVFYRRKEEEFIKDSKKEIESPFDWHEENQYFAILDKQPLFDIFCNIHDYKFENICKAIYSRSIVTILGVMFVYLICLPIIIRNKIFKKYMLSIDVIEYRYEIKWLRYFTYTIGKNEFWKTFGYFLSTCLFLVVKCLDPILYALYWIFDRILKPFILPIAYIFKWIILLFTILWLLGSQK